MLVSTTLSLIFCLLFFVFLVNIFSFEYVFVLSVGRFLLKVFKQSYSWILQPCQICPMRTVWSFRNQRERSLTLRTIKKESLPSVQHHRCSSRAVQACCLSQCSHRGHSPVGSLHLSLAFLLLDTYTSVVLGRSGGPRSKETLR